MTLTKQKFREIVLQLLYSFDTHTTDPSLIVHLMAEELSLSKDDVSQAFLLAEKIYASRETLDAQIATYSTTYETERIQQVTRNILRIALYEMLFDPSIPHKVAIAEAIRLSRKFNTPESANFVNALLDAFYKAQQKNL